MRPFKLDLNAVFRRLGAVDAPSQEALNGLVDTTTLEMTSFILRTMSGEPRPGPWLADRMKHELCPDLPHATWWTCFREEYWRQLELWYKSLGTSAEVARHLDQLRALQSAERVRDALLTDSGLLERQDVIPLGSDTGEFYNCDCAAVLDPVLVDGYFQADNLADLQGSWREIFSRVGIDAALYGDGFVVAACCDPIHFSIEADDLRESLVEEWLNVVASATQEGDCLEVMSHPEYEPEGGWSNFIDCFLEGYIENLCSDHHEDASEQVEQYDGLRNRLIAWAPHANSGSVEDKALDNYLQEWNRAQTIVSYYPSKEKAVIMVDGMTVMQARQKTKQLAELLTKVITEAFERLTEAEPSAPSLSQTLVA